MPKIAQYTARNAPQGVVRGAESSAVDLSGLASGVSRLAGSMDQLREEQERQRAQLEQDEARSYASNASSKAQADWLERLQQAETDAQGDAAGFTEKAKKDFEQYAKEAEKAAPEMARPLVRERMVALGTSVHAKAFNFEVKSRQGALITQYAEGLKADSQVVWSDITQFGPKLAERRALVNSLGLEPDQRARLTEQTTSLLATTAAGRMAEKDPLGTLEALKEPGKHLVLSKLTIAQLSQIEQQAQAESQRGIAGLRTGIAAQEKDLQAMVMAGVTPPASMIPKADDYKVFGADAQRRYQTEVQTYLDVGNGIQRLRLLGPDERIALIASMEPPVDQPGYDERKKIQNALVQANSLITDRLKKDPAAYAVEASPRVQEAAGVMSQVLRDPNSLSASVAKLAGYSDVPRAAIDSYALAQNAEQTRLGVANPQLLTDQQAKGVVQQFYSQKAGGKNAAQLIKEQEQTWGRWWPQVFGQLSKDEKMPAAALVIPSIKDEGARTRLAEWSTMKPDERKALLIPSDVRDINDKLLSQFSSAAGTFLAQGVGGQKTLATIIEQAEILAQGYKSQGKSISAAAEQAFTEVMGANYDFMGTFRVPKEQQPLSVQEGAGAFVKHFDRVLPMRGTEGLKPDDAKKQTLDAIRTRHLWVTNRDETGLLLMVQGKDGGVMEVRQEDGKPVSLSWSELRSRAMTDRTERVLKKR